MGKRASRKSCPGFANCNGNLDLQRPIFKKTAAYGHFGREDPDFTWEKIDKAKLLKKEAGL